ncbi:hypothetical protein [Maribacter litoralis]|uniref:hypothetical protein n=1 Tax=Maribacter litoralis TaxID=2059726 RepID=UPI003D2B6562
MAVTIDFLTKEIFVKIVTKILGVIRTLYLLYVFGVSKILDNFYFAYSIVGLILIVNILFETTYSREINLFRERLYFHKFFLKKLNLFVLFFSSVLLFLSFFLVYDKEIYLNIIVLTIWSLLNINSYYLLLVYRYLRYNQKILTYYLLISFLNVLLLIVYLKAPFVSKEYDFLSLSLSILLSEFCVFYIVFGKYIRLVIRSKGELNIFLSSKDFKKVALIMLVLIIISLIDIVDKSFLSSFGEGAISIYTYGYYAPLIIRQALDIKSNFFVQINLLRDGKKINQVFFSTVKKICLFFVIAASVLLLIVQVFDKNIIALNIVTSNQFFEIKDVLLVGLVITPFYMVWDLFYRFYYRRKIIFRLLIVSLIGLIFNVLLNYILGIYFGFKILGIMYSTLAVFMFYNFYSYYIFFVKKRN